MKRNFITVFALLAWMKAYPQNQPADSSGYEKRKLKIEEVNWVSGYYTQDGNNSAVTGGVGTEELTDFSNTVDLKLIKYGKDGVKNNLTIEVGLDNYTSASSDMIDLSANSSASSADNRFYPSLSYLRENDVKGQAVGGGLSFSSEYDYFSAGANIHFAKKSKNRNGEFTAKFQSFFDQVTMIKPIELRGGPGRRREPRNTYALSLSYSQIINPELQVVVLGDVITQKGYLGLPFHRVYFNNTSVRMENLPDTRLKIPLAVMASYFPGGRVIIKAYYRYYMDDWKISSHTFNLEIPIKVTPTFSLSPFGRMYVQQATEHFAGYGEYTIDETYYTSNYDLSAFNSNFVGLGLKYIPLRGIFGIKHFNAVEFRYGHYTKSTDMISDVISMHLKFK